MDSRFTLSERLYIEKRVRKTVNESIKRKMAQRLIESKYAERNNVNYFISKVPKEDLKGILETYEMFKEPIKLAVADIERKIFSGELTKSKHQVHKILREHQVINRKGIIKENAADIIFGFGPPLLQLIGMIPGLQIATAAGTGLAIAGIIYYGYKFSQDMAADNVAGMIINGISILFCWADASPTSLAGKVVGGMAKVIGGILKAIFKGITAFIKTPFRLIAGKVAEAQAAKALRGLAGGATELTGTQLDDFVAYLQKQGYEVVGPNAGEEAFKVAKELAAGKTVAALSEGSTALLKQSGEMALKHAKKFKILNNFIAGSNKVMIGLVSFLEKISYYIGKVPGLGRITKYFDDGFKAIKANSEFIIKRSQLFTDIVDAAVTFKTLPTDLGALLQFVLTRSKVADQSAEAILKLTSATQNREAMLMTLKSIDELAEIAVKVEESFAAAEAKTATQVDTGLPFADDFARINQKEAMEATLSGLTSLSTEAAKKMKATIERVVQNNIEQMPNIAQQGIKNIDIFKQQLSGEISRRTLETTDNLLAALGKTGAEASAFKAIPVEGIVIKNTPVESFGTNVNGDLVINLKNTISAGGRATKEIPLGMLQTLAPDLYQKVMRQFADNSVVLIRELEEEVARKAAQSQRAQKMGLEMATSFDQAYLDTVKRYIASGGNETLAVFRALNGVDNIAYQRLITTTFGILPKYVGAPLSSANLTPSFAEREAGREARLAKLNPNRRKGFRYGDDGSGVASANVTFT